MTLEVNVVDFSVTADALTTLMSTLTENFDINISLIQDSIDVDLANRNNLVFNFGSRSSSLHAGVSGELWYDDDWLYICVQTGSIGNAKWKKIPLINT